MLIQGHADFFQEGTTDKVADVLPDAVIEHWGSTDDLFDICLMSGNLQLGWIKEGKILIIFHITHINQEK